MKRKLYFLFLILILAMYLSGCGINLKGQARFTVEGKVYALVGIEVLQAEDFTKSFVKITLACLEGFTQESDAEAISQVPGIVIVNPDGASVAVAEVIFNPSGSGYILISFKTGNHLGPWTLLWPAHEAVLIT